MYRVSESPLGALVSPTLTALSFGVDGVVLVDPELVKGKRGEAGLPGLVRAGTGKRASGGRARGGRWRSAAHPFAPRCLRPFTHSPRSKPQGAGSVLSRTHCPHFSDEGEGSGKLRGRAWGGRKNEGRSEPPSVRFLDGARVPVPMSRSSLPGATAGGFLVG